MDFFFCNGEDAGDAFAFPVQGVHVPEDREHGDGEFHVFDPCTEGWTDVGGIGASDFVDAVVCFFDFQAGLWDRDFVKLDVIPGVIADQVAVLLHLLKDAFISFDVFSDKEERGMDVSFPQAVQKERRVGCIGTVIEGEGDPGRFFCRDSCYVFDF